jgi:hypothetical protein
LALVVIFGAGFSLGYFRRGHLYKQSTDVQMALDRLPESSAISAITWSEVGRKYPDVTIRNLSTVASTNAASK